MMETKKRDSLIRNITFMALMAAINVVFVLLTTLVPVLVFLIVFVLPLTSAIVVIHCKKRYFPIYAVATVGLCLICTIWKIDDTIFYVIPSIISGFIFGLFAEKKVPSYWIILTTAIIQIGFTYASIPLIKLMTGRDIVEVFAVAFGINNFQYLSYVVPCFIFFISMAQEILAYMVIREELPKFGYELNEPKNLPLSLAICLTASISLAVIFAFVYGPISYLFTLISLYLAIYAIIQLVTVKNKIVYILLAVTLIVSIFLFALIYPNIPKPLGLILVNIYFIFVAIIVLINNYLLKPHKEDTIK